MIAALTLAIAINSPVQEFFPLATGASWTYEVAERGGRTLRSRDEVGAPENIGTRPAIPVISRMAGVQTETIYYRFEGDTLFIVAYDPSDPLDEPMPILRVTGRAERWEYTGRVPFATDKVTMTMSGQSRPGRRRTVLGREVETYESSYEAQFGGGETAVVVKQSAVYGRGIGLIEMTNEGRVARNTTRTTLRLVDFTPGRVEGGGTSPGEASPSIGKQSMVREP